MSKINIIRREGGSRIVAITNVLPKDWVAVELIVVNHSQSAITIRFNKVK